MTTLIISNERLKNKIDLKSKPDYFFSEMYQKINIYL